MTTDTVVTIQDKLAANDAWRERVAGSDADYATPEWKARAFASIATERAALLDAQQIIGDAPLPNFRDVAHGSSLPYGITELFSAPEYWAILWQYREHLNLGRFTDLLLQTASEADGKNLERLAAGWPDLVAGILRWRSEGGFATRIRALLAGAD